MADIDLDANVQFTVSRSAGLGLARPLAAGSVPLSISATVDLTRIKSVAASAAVALASVSSAALEVDRGVAADLDIDIGTADAELRVENSLLGAARAIRFQEAATLTSGISLAGNSPLRISNRALLGVGLTIQSKVPPELFTFTSKACLDAGRTTLGACDIIAEIMMLWGMEDFRNAPAFARRRAMHDFNASVQTVWNQAKDRDYWTRETQTLMVAAGASTLDLGDSIQNVIGPARLTDGSPLTPVTTRGELDQAMDLFLDESNVETFPPGLPVFYFIERLRQSGRDPARCIFHVSPEAPGEGLEVKLDVVTEAPRFGWADVDRCTEVPMPHQYVESLLLPIARMAATGSHLFIANDRMESIQSDYAMAMALMDNADPLPVTGGDKAERRGA